MLLRVLVLASTSIPAWLQEPGWLRPATHAIGRLIVHHPTLGLFSVVFAEELGIPLPVPGDVAVMTGGYLTTTGAIPYPLAYLAVVAGAMTGSLSLFTLSRRFGHPFVVRFGRYVGLDARRLVRAESWFQRYGPWAIIIGRQIPGMRIVLSALAGTLEVPYRVFVPSVLAAALIWAVMFIEIGRHLGRQVFVFFRLLPADVLPGLFLLLILVAIGFFGYEHGYQRVRNARRGVKSPKREADQPL
jgi:membrane protein DedA with SNARE-associated domain